MKSTQNKKNVKKGNKKPVPKKKVVVVAPPRPSAVLVKQAQEKKKMNQKFGIKHSNFFISCLDPMHDSGFATSGWPDKNTASSVIRRLPYAVDLTMPVDNAHFADQETWDCHVIFNPWLNRVEYSLRDRLNNCLLDAEGDSETYIGCLQAYAALAGTNFAYGANFDPASAFPEIGALQPEPDIILGVGRVIGLGIEIINVTAELYTAGDLYSWRAPEPIIEGATWFTEVSEAFAKKRDSTGPGSPVTRGAPAAITVASKTPFDATVVRHPPRNPSEALFYPGSLTFKAKQGAYSVATFTDFENRAKMVSYQQPLFMRSTDVEDQPTNVPFGGVINAPNDTPVFAPRLLTGVGPGTLQGLPAFQPVPLNQMGFVLTGLPKQTKLTMRMIVIYESFPSLAQKDILTLARPTTKFDESILQIIEMVTRKMPTAVPSNWNASGDWWDNVLKIIQGLTPPVLALTGGAEFVPMVEGFLSTVRAARN